MYELQELSDIEIYTNIFKNVSILFSRHGKDPGSQKKDISDIYLNCYVGLLRSGVERALVKKEDYYSIVIQVEGKSYGMKKDVLLEKLGEEYEAVVETENYKDCTFLSQPEYYEEEEPKKADDFIYARYHLEITNSDTGRKEETTFDVYPERVPREAGDKIKTVVTVKGTGEGSLARNSIFIGGVGESTSFHAGKCEFIVKCEVTKDGTISAKPRVINKNNCEINITQIKEFNTKVAAKLNSHMIVTVSGQEVHVFPINYESNDSKGCAEAVALVGTERVAIVPAGANIIPITSEDDTRTNIKFYWKNESLHYEI